MNDYFEIENGMPEHWETNVIYERLKNGEIVRVEVPDDNDDEEDENDAEHD